MLATVDNDDVAVMADDDDEYRATEISTQLINSHHMDQKENNITNTKYDESIVNVENLIEPDVNKFLCGNGKLNFPKANRMHGKHSDTKVLSKVFPLKYANQNVNKKSQKLPEYKCLQQLHTDICALRAYNGSPSKASMKDFSKFPISQRIQMQYRRSTFPCTLFEEDKVFKGTKPAEIFESSVKLSNNVILGHQRELSFLNGNLINGQFKESIAWNKLLKKFPTSLTIQNVNKVPQLTEFKCLQQLHANICAMRSNLTISSTSSTKDLIQFPTSQRIHIQNRRYTFPCTSCKENDVLNDIKSIGSLECIAKLEIVEEEFSFANENSFLSESKRSLQKFPLKISNRSLNNNNLKIAEVKGQQQLHAKIQHYTSVESRNLSEFPYINSSHTFNKWRSFPYSLEVDNDVVHTTKLALTSAYAVKLPISELYCNNKATFLNPPKNRANKLLSQTLYQKSNLCIADLKVADTFGGNLLRHSSFPCISMKVTKSANFPIQNISLDPVANPSQHGHTSRTISLAYQSQNCDRAREIQVQLNQEHLKETAENSKILEHSNYYLEQEQHINDAVDLAAAITKTKNTTESSSSQINDGDHDDDERNNSVCVGGESTNMYTSTGAQMNINHDNENNEPNFFDTDTPPSTPPTLENLKLLDSYTNCTIESAANFHHHILSTSTPCSDVRDSSSQEVPSPLNVNVSCSERLTTETRPLLLEEIAAAVSTNLVTLPKYYLNNTEVDENLIEHTRTALLSVGGAQTNVQNIEQQETEIAKNINEAMTLTEIEESGVLSEFSSVLDDNLSHQQDLVGIEELQSNEMKLEMKTARGSILSTTNAETPARRYSTTQLKNEQNLTSAHRPTVNNYGADIGKSLSGGSASTRNREISTRTTTAPAESIAASNSQRRHSLTGSSAIGHNLQTGNAIATGPATDRSIYRGTALSGNTLTSSAAALTNSPRRSSLTGSTTRANDVITTDRTTLRGSTLSGTATTIITPTTTTSSHRRSSLTGSMPKANDILVDTTIGSSSTNTGPIKYRRAPTKYVPSQETNDITRTVSLDAVDSVLPARTLLRRQRRMRSQDSYDEPPESAIERLNRLRARISGALSEVKGVLKHYSTDAEEADGAVEVSSALKMPTTKTYMAPDKQAPENVANKPIEFTTTTPAIEQQEPTKTEDGPVAFRFRRVVRRRSIFDEEDEDREKEKQADIAVVAEINKLTDEETGTIGAITKGTEVSRHGIKSSNEISSQNDKKTEIPDDVANQSNTAAKTNISLNENTESLSAELPKDKYVELLNDKSESKPDVENYDCALETNIENASTEKLTKTVSEDIVSKQSADSAKSKDQEVTMPTVVSEDMSEIKTKLKKKLSPSQTAESHTKRTVRRASIAAVEGSKIEPPIQTLISLDIKKQRRPSDSEAILKKKSIKVKTTATSEAGGESASPKVKLINKVKRPSLKRANIATQVTTETITNAMTDDTKSTPASIIQNNSSVSGDMQANNSNKDAPKTAITAASAAATLATQLVIDDASLTISQATVANTDSKATKESTVASDIAVVIPLVSPLRANEQSSQLKKSTIEIQKLAAEELLAETPIIVINNNKSLEEKIDQSKTAAVFEKIGSNSELEDNEKVLLAEKSTEPNRITATTSEKNEISDVISVLNESKKPINQKVELDTINEQVRRTTPENQQVSAEILKAPASSAAVANDVFVADSIRSTLTTTTFDALLSPSSIEATKAKATSATTHSSVATGKSEASTDTMPELQVKAAQVFIEPNELVETKEPFNVTKENAQKKKVVILKKLVRKNSTEKSQANNKIDFIKTFGTIKDKSKKDIAIDATKTVQDVDKLGETINEIIETTIEIPTDDEEIPNTEIEEQNEETVEEPPAPEKKKRKIKKKVIIKRQQRRLSVSDSTFFKVPEVEPTSTVEETLEKPIEYIKVASDEEQDYEEIPTPAKPQKSCLKVREFQVGDLVMYAERFKKTQVRWKRGTVLERITSISYKLEIEGKEVPAHISYIKKYTARKVNFGGKEYLEIDYEQIAEEEEKARSYSIWNMV